MRVLRKLKNSLKNNKKFRFSVFDKVWFQFLFSKRMFIVAGMCTGWYQTKDIYKSIERKIYRKIEILYPNIWYRITKNNITVLDFLSIKGLHDTLTCAFIENNRRQKRNTHQRPVFLCEISKSFDKIVSISKITFTSIYLIPTERDRMPNGLRTI